MILLVPGEGIEPPTNGLQNRCSTAELTRHGLDLSAFIDGPQTVKPSIATILLPFLSSGFGAAFVYGCGQGFVNESDRIGLHVRQNV